MVRSSKKLSSTYRLGTAKNPTDTPPIMITNFCNQNCHFCFARKEMNSSKKREMSISDFRIVIKKLKQSNFARIALLGGEPTLHSQFEEIIKLTAKNFFVITIYTNGLFSKKTASILKQYPYQAHLTFNISSPAFKILKVRKIIIDNIYTFVSSSRVTLSVVNNFQELDTVKKLFGYFDDKMLKKVDISLSLATPIVGDKNSICFSDFPSIGSNLYKLVEYLLKTKSPRGVNIRDGVTRCMFVDNRQYKFLKDNCRRVGEGIASRSPGEQGLFDVSVDLYAFSDFSMSPLNRLKIDKNTSFLYLREKFNELRQDYSLKYPFPPCKSCSFSKLNRGPCPGPGISFRINELIKKGHFVDLPLQN